MKFAIVKENHRRITQMIDDVLNYIRKYHMLEMEDTVVVGVSGGTDSICLLSILMDIQIEYRLTLHVVHINHGIRQEARGEAKFVENLCKQYNLPFYLIEVHIKELAKERLISEEEAGREERYKAFNNVLGQLGFLNHPKGKIAVAHNKNDRAETVLFNLFRGSGLKGMNGIPSVRGQIIRPIMCLERKQIELYLKERNLCFCIDKTNDEDAYTRNRIRHHILPYAEEHICKNVIPHITETAVLLEEIEIFMQKQTKNAVKECVLKEENDFVEIDISKLLTFEAIIQKYAIRDCIIRLNGNTKDITALHIGSIVELFHKGVGKTISLPNKMIAKRGYSTLILAQDKQEPDQLILGNKQKEFIENAPIPGTVFVEGLGTLEFYLLKKCEYQIFPEKIYTKWFDYDKIKESVCVRTRQSGDYLTINEKGNRKSLKAYLINEKILKEERNSMIVLADGNHIIWVLGHRISQEYKVSSETNRILQVQIRGGMKND